MRRRYKYLEPEAASRLRNLNLVARSVVEGFVSGLHRSPYHGFSVEFADHRKYTPGDNIRDLDWRAWAKSDRFYIKRYEEETNVNAHLLLDVSASMTFRSRGLSKLEYACFLAASLAYLMVRQQDSVGLVVFADGIEKRLPPHSSTLHLNELLRTLETVEPVAETDIAATFHQLAEMIKRRGLIVILSDLLDEEREVLRALRHFRHRRHEVIIFHILDPAERRFPYSRLSDFIDLETGSRLQVDPRFVRQDYLKQIEAFINTYRKGATESNIEYVLADTATPYDRLLLAYLARRSKVH
ncbi:MAG: DUF58 domain-containing protein [Planctomycetes bacterium]|nr:DUF58 domain-containing protein [Planctomycetota bacterium]